MQTTSACTLGKQLYLVEKRAVQHLIRLLLCNQSDLGLHCTQTTSACTLNKQLYIEEKRAVQILIRLLLCDESGLGLYSVLKQHPIVHQASSKFVKFSQAEQKVAQILIRLLHCVQSDLGVLW